MKTPILLLISLATLAAQGAQENKDQSAAAPAAKAAPASKATKSAKTGSAPKSAPGLHAVPAPPPAPEKDPSKLEIPAGAVLSEDGFYRYTDANGKKWLYRKTPFGIARNEDLPMPPKQREEPGNLKAIEDGDSIRFERPGPFGTYKWQRKKTELNEVEQAAWDREKARGAAKQD